MAEAVNMVIAQEAIKQVQTLVSELTKADAELIQLSANALKASKSISSITTPSSLSKSQGDNAKTLSDLDKLQVKYAKLHETMAKKAEQSRLAEIKLQQQREKAFDSFEKNAKKEEEAIAKANGAYQKIQNSVNVLTQTYNNLAIRKQLGNTLTAKEEKQLETLTKRINLYQSALLKTDSQIGKNQRNVGNYASGYNALGNSINQLTREAPAFANSMQTGFMAISNNFAALQDSISGINKQNKELAAQGQPTVSVLKQLAGAMFSWTTLISIGVTLLTVYGAKMVDFIFNTDASKKALEKLNVVQKRYSDTLAETNTNIQHQLTLQQEQIKRQQAINKLKSVGRDITEENINSELNAQKQLTKLDVEAAKTRLKNVEEIRNANKKAYNDEVNSILKEKGLSDKRIEINQNEFKLYEQLKNKKNELDKQRAKEELFLAYNDKPGKEREKHLNDFNKIVAESDRIQRYLFSKREIMSALNDSEILKAKRDNLIKSENAVKEAGQALSELTAQTNTKIIQDETQANEDKLKIREEYLKDLAELTIKELELELLKQESVVDNEDLYYSDRITALEKSFAIRKQIAKSNFDEDFRLAKENNEKKKIAEVEYQIESIKLSKDYIKKRADLSKLDLDVIEKLNKTFNLAEISNQLEASGKKVQKQIEKDGEHADKLKAKILELKGVTSNWLQSFSGEFLQNSGLGNLNTFFDGTFKSLLAGSETSKEKFAVYFNSIAESAQEAFDFISQLSENNFASEKNRLQNQYDISLKYAGDNKEAQEKLAADLELKKKEIANREAKAKQRQAIFNIAIDTAQAIIGLWATPGFPAAIPLAIAVGAIGAAQIAMVASQEIPQYWMGGTHDGGLMMVNDGKGSNYRETIVTPDGKITKPQGRNVIMDAPAGTEIFTHEQWNNELNGMLKGRNIEPVSNSNYYGGISKNDLRSVMMETLGSMPSEHLNIDANGFSKYTNRRGNITKLNSQRGQGRGIKF